MFSLTKSKKEDSSSCATTESQKGERNKKKEEESNSLKAAILELIFAITIVCFVQIGTTTKMKSLKF